MHPNSEYQINQWLVLFNKSYPIIPMRYDVNIPVSVEIDATDASAKDLNAKIFQLLNERKSTFIEAHAQLLTTLQTKPTDTSCDEMKTYLNNMISQLGETLVMSVYDPLVMHCKLTALNSLNLDADAIVNQDILKACESTIETSDAFFDRHEYSDQLSSEMFKMKQDLAQQLQEMNTPNPGCTIS